MPNITVCAGLSGSGAGFPAVLPGVVVLHPTLPQQRWA
jgi:hypothetical protein